MTDPPAALRRAMEEPAHEAGHVLGRADPPRFGNGFISPTVERIGRHWLLRCFDVVLVLTVLGGVLYDALAFSHVAALVLVFQAFLLTRRSALTRVALSAAATVAAALAHGAAPQDLAIQVPFVYGLSTLVVLLADTLRRSHGTAIGALRETERVALYDQLTGLPNRLLFADRVDHALGAARRTGGTVALLLMDLDHFKDVNDSFGHRMGDLLLAAVGPRLRDELRDGDTAARFGGDEFGVLLPGAGAPTATAIAERLVAAIERPFALDGRSLSVSTSIGIACSPEHALDADTLLQRADIAMYAAKRTRGTYATYDPTAADEGGAERLALASELAEAIGTDQLILHYQPQVDTATGRLVAVEALVRWQHPRRGLVAPVEFVPLAERSGLIGRLTEHVLRLAARQVRGWRAAGRQIAVAVNISTRDLRDPRFAALVREILRENDVPASALILEVTESALLADQQRAVETVARLRELGLRISVDDYGSGYSSISYLSRLAPDEVKIDNAFVRGLRSDRRSEAIVRATIELGHALDIKVVAEGVEDRGTWLRLRELGVDRLQGYAIARPMAPEALAAWTDPREAVSA